MLPKNKSGSILIPLVILLTLSVGVFIISKYFSTSQANVEQAIDSRYQLSPSQHMDRPDKWIAEKNDSYHFEIFYPKQWVASQAPKPKNKEVLILEKSLSSRVKLKLSVFENYQVPSESKLAKFDKNSFYLLEDSQNTKTAITKTDKLYFLIELSQNNYFTNEVEFKSTYFQILKKFKYSGK